ncbi:MAG: hypothetical protein CMH52_07390 [Myxococcales bacterium]|nr:hypothetical protein [Myxococcales bacterium]
MADFHGSYEPDDVCFLLKVIEMEPTPVEQKERLIQSGARHYSEMLSKEREPAPSYLQLFHQAFDRNRLKMAKDIKGLAQALGQLHPDGLILVSLARAGTPIGVLLKRALKRIGLDCPHYSVSIIRDRGIDECALDEIRSRHPNQPIRFIDGWTGKGAISHELSGAVTRYNESRSTQLDTTLVVLTDLAGTAGLSAGYDDYLIPSALLNSVVSGLVSRTILNDEFIRPGDYHGCLFLDELITHDLSRWFVDGFDDLIDACVPTVIDVEQSARLRRGADTVACIRDIARTYECSDLNRIKPGVGEATRALLRRMPKVLLIRDRHSEDVEHLIHLANTRGIDWHERPDLAFSAVTVIATLGHRHKPWPVD